MSRKLDAAICEALGWENIKIHPHGAWGEPSKGFRYGDIRDVEDVPLYSTDGNAMSELEREMQKFCSLTIHSMVDPSMVPFYRAIYTTGDNEFYADADTMPEAVALAAYKALTGIEWNER